MNDKDLVLFIIIGVAVTLIVGTIISNNLDKENPPVYRIDGNEVTCNRTIYDKCGVYLSQCDNGIEYSCMTNLEELK